MMGALMKLEHHCMSSPRIKESKIKELDSSLFMKMVDENHL